MCSGGRLPGPNHADVAIHVVERHAEVELLALQQIGDLLHRLLADVLDLEQVFLGELDQVAERPVVGVLERVERPDRQTEVVDRLTEAVAEAAARGRRAGLAGHVGHLPERAGVADVLLRERRRVGDRILGRDGAVRLDRHGEPFVVGTLADAGFSHREVRAPDRIIDGVDADEIHRQRSVGWMELGFDVAPSLVDVELHRDVPVVLQREEQVVGIHDADRPVLLDVAGMDRTRTLALDVQDGFIHLGIEHERERLEALHDLVHVFEHPRDRLVLVHHTLEPEAPDGGAAERRQQQAAEGVAERVAESALQRLEAELGDVGVVVPLRHFDEVRANQSGQVDAHGYFEYSSTMSCSWALTGMASRVGTSRTRPAAWSVLMSSQLTGWPRVASSCEARTATMSRLAGATRTSWPGTT